MTTEAKLKKLEEDQIILEDQNCKLAKVRPSMGGDLGCGEQARPQCLATPSHLWCLMHCGFCSVADSSSWMSHGLWVPGSFEGIFSYLLGLRERSDVS